MSTPCCAVCNCVVTTAAHKHWTFLLQVLLLLLQVLLLLFQLFLLLFLLLLPLFFLFIFKLDKQISFSSFPQLCLLALPVCSVVWCTLHVSYSHIFGGMFPRVFGDEFGDKFGDECGDKFSELPNLVIILVMNLVMNLVNCQIR